MKNKIIAAVVLAGLLVPALVSASTVHIYSTIENAHGGTKGAADIRVWWEIDGTRFSDTGVPSFYIASSSTYAVLPSAPTGYSVTASTTCSGVASDKDIICQLWYADGAPVVTGQVPPPPTAQTVTPIPDENIVAPLVEVAQRHTLTAPQVAAIIGLLEAFGVDPKVVGIVAVILYGN